MRRPLFLVSAILLAALSWTRLSAQAAAPSDAPYRNPATPLDQRVADLLSRMTLEEKATMLSGSEWMESAPIERLGIPAIKMADGQLRVRSRAGRSAITSAANGPSAKVLTTSFPSGVTMAATWDTGLVQREGQAIAQEVNKSAWITYPGKFEIRVGASSRDIRLRAPVELKD